MPRIALLSDTHGLLRPEALAFLAGSDHIVHGGDIGGPEILAQLAAIAPLSVVRGNNDRGPWAEAIPPSLTVTLSGVAVHAVHDIADLQLGPADAEVRVVVSGHSHKPSMAERDGILFINPGSAGPRRFSLPISVAELLIDDGGRVTPRLVTLAVPPTPRRR
ncbi:MULTISPECIES: metallophosphoesterase family protein [unclassified Variovorax]|uniref:metallophosphoesterase family protein n=1 Tax=unclassified Variovorax TaxID=663243 RepID=UPI002574902A|nr:MULTISPECIES: metallophosphoesterase family protein [unclassified Variovorax]MDM0090945.1 metallophosphoesterase family protein [Variovorax sp. J22G40]MDM0149053.1 metallophosphoesterase family protein [Variovorax sp. J2P1-31]